MPAGHLLHSELPSLDMLPDRQGMHANEPDVKIEKVPAGHGGHLSGPEKSLNVPGPQNSHPSLS